MTKLTLYYPGFAYPDHDPESITYNSPADILAEPTISDRLCKKNFFTGKKELIQLYAYKTTEPEKSFDGKQFWIHLFHKNGGFWCACNLTSDNRDELKKAIEELHVQTRTW